MDNIPYGSCFIAFRSPARPNPTDETRSTEREITTVFRSSPRSRQNEARSWTRAISAILWSSKSCVCVSHTQDNMSLITCLEWIFILNRDIAVLNRNIFWHITLTAFQVKESSISFTIWSNRFLPPKASQLFNSNVFPRLSSSREDLFGVAISPACENNPSTETYVPGIAR